MKHTYIYEQNHYDNSTAAYLWHFGTDTKDELIYCNWHKEIELIYVRKGILALYIDEKPITIREGEIGIVNSNRLHFGSAVGGGCLISVLLIDPWQLLSRDPGTDERHLRALTADELWFPSHIAKDHPIYNEIIEIMGQMASCFALRPCAFELKLKSLLFELLFLFSGHKDFFVHEREWGTARSKDKKERLLTLIRYLDTHYQESLTVADLAQSLYMGADSFYKFMISVTGSSPVAFLTQFRLQKAAVQLENTTCSITEVCFASGFSNVSYFIKCFRKFYGITPGKYRSDLQAAAGAPPA